MGAVNKYEWIDVGSSFVPSELSCAVLWAQLENIDYIMSRRRIHFQQYMEALSALQRYGKFRVSVIPDGCTSNAHIFFLVFSSDELATYYEIGLKSYGISAFSHYIPLHSSPAGLKYGKIGSSMSITNRVYKRLLRLPMWTDLKEDQIQSIICRLKELTETCPLSNT